MPKKKDIDPSVRRSPQTLSLLASLLDHASEWRHGYDISRETDLKSGTLYPILMRLSERGWMEAKWEQPSEPGRPPRHLYRLTANGREWARDYVKTEASASQPSRKRARKLNPAFERGAL